MLYLYSRCRASVFLMNTQESKVSVSPLEECNINSLESGLLFPWLLPLFIVTVPVFLLADISAESKMADKLKSHALSVLKFYFILACDFYRFKTSFPKRGSELWGCKNFESFLLFCNYFIPCHR